MVLINRIRFYGSKDWPNDKVTRLFLDAYQDKDWHMARMIRDRDDYEGMTPHQLFAKINSIEVAKARREASRQEQNALVAHPSTCTKQVAFKAVKDDGQAKTRSSKHKKATKGDSSSDDSSSSDDELEHTAMYMKNVRRLVRSERFLRKSKKRPCYRCGKVGHFIADCPFKESGVIKKEDKKEYKKDRSKRGREDEWEC